MLFFKAILLGFAVAIPLGPIGALCITRTLHGGFAAGFAGGVGTALADAAYAGLAAFGFAALSGVLDQGAGWVRILGGVLLIGLGIRGWLAGGGTATPAKADARTLMSTAAATFALTIANPATILSFAAMFAGLGLADDASATAAGLAVAGVFLGSLMWWALLSGGVALTRSRLPAGSARVVARISALMLIALGVWALVPAL